MAVHGAPDKLQCIQYNTMVAEYDRTWEAVYTEAVHGATTVKPRLTTTPLRRPPRQYDHYFPVPNDLTLVSMEVQPRLDDHPASRDRDHL